MRAFIFDLDGTLVDSLEDIGQACNDVLSSHGYPVHPLPKYRFYVGRGFHKLVGDALPEGETARLSSNDLAALITEARAQYGKNMCVRTKPYEGITEKIAAIVKTIQTDTQSAVSAMEESTRGVVEGAHLSDAAGQALAEIGSVSQTLAELIDRISSATRLQADAATGVAGKMQDILQVTEQTTVGTQRTASAVGELAGLATELKGSVAGFKVV